MTLKLFLTFSLRHCYQLWLIVYLKLDVKLFVTTLHLKSLLCLKYTFVHSCPEQYTLIPSMAIKRVVAKLWSILFIAVHNAKRQHVTCRRYYRWLCRPRVMSRLIQSCHSYSVIFFFHSVDQLLCSLAGIIESRLIYYILMEDYGIFNSLMSCAYTFSTAAVASDILCNLQKTHLKS